MSHILTDLGEEYVIKNGAIGSGFVVGLYLDATDAISDTDDLSDITTEPAGASYAAQSAVMEADDDGDWHAQANAAIEFDTSDSSTSVDSYYIAKSFQAVDTSDGSPTLHLLYTGALSQTRDLSQIDTLTLSLGGVGIKLS